MPGNVEAVGIWCLCDAHERQYVGMDGWPARINRSGARDECDRTEDPEGNFRKVMLLEGLIYPKRYKRKPQKKK